MCVCVCMCVWSEGGGSFVWVGGGVMDKILYPKTFQEIRPGNK